MNKYLGANGSLYWAVECRDCEHPILLALVDFDSDGIGRTVVWTLEPFQASCLACQKGRVYEKDQVVMCWGPPPSQNFQAHPALQSHTRQG